MFPTQPTESLPLSNKKKKNSDILRNVIVFPIE